MGVETASAGFGAAPKLGEPWLTAPGCLADVVARKMETTAQALENLGETEWTPAAQALGDLFLTLAHSVAKAAGVPQGGAQAALLHRTYQTFERRLDDAELVPAEVAASVGISERYLQKLLEGAGTNFSQHLRERPLACAHADLESPLEAQRSISEIAYRYGFSDCAHFSRVLR